jgi:hypothetical protein
VRAIAVVLLSLPIVLGAPRAEAATVPAVQTANGTAVNWRNFIGANQSASVGWSFSVGAQDQEVVALGIYDAGMVGLADAHAVGIWTSGGTLLAQAFVPSGTAGTLVGSYRYTAIAPLTLTAGQTYFVGTYFGPVPDQCGSACGDVLLYSGPETYAPGIAFLQARQTLPAAGAGSLAFPNLNAGIPEGVFGPNFLLTVPLTRIIGLSAASLDFGFVTVGQPSPAQTVTVSNTGTDALSIAPVALSGSHAAEFAISSDTCSNQSLAPNATCSVGVSLTPAATGARTAQVEFPSDATSGPYTVTLAGSGVQSQLTLDVSAIDFGARPLGSLATANVTVTNTGSGDLVISGLSDPGAPFAITGGSCTALPATLAPAAGCQVIVQFAPGSTIGSFTSSFDIVSNAPSSPDTVELAAASAAASVPALGTWGLALQALLLGWLGCRLRSRSVV